MIPELGYIFEPTRLEEIVLVLVLDHRWNRGLGLEKLSDNLLDLLNRHSLGWLLRPLYRLIIRSQSYGGPVFQEVNGQVFPDLQYFAFLVVGPIMRPATSQLDFQHLHSFLQVELQDTA